MADYLTFEEVLEELGIDEEELKKLVSQGELRGFRDGMSMKFKTDDVFDLKRGRETEPTIILTDSEDELGIAESSDELILDESTSDTVLNIGDIMGIEDQSEIIFSDSTEAFSLSPHDSDPEAAIPTVEVPSVSDSEIPLIDSDLIEVGVGSSIEETEQFELMDDDDETADVAIAPRRGASGRISRSAKLRSMEIREKSPHTAWTIVAMLTGVLMVLPAAFMVASQNNVSPDWLNGFADNFKGLFTSILSMFA